ncbi:unnamed protein product [Meganyctiphanes norvegica]|uniref:Uncharacterized protein n=1 Tax=Meganyctiphanes norvegica TaxID=48144 RepID=A0AAV2PN36_MEGNR
MSIAGTYVLESNSNYDAWLSAVGMPEENMKRMVAAKPIMEVAVSGSTVTVTTKANDKEFTNTITSGKESKASLPGGIDYSVNLTVSGSTIKGTFNFLGKPGNAELVFTAAGFSQTVTAAGVTAKRVYKRQ